MQVCNEKVRRQDRICEDPALLKVLLDEAPMMHVAMNDEGFPHVVPLSYGYEFVGDKLKFYFHGAAVGRKVALWKKNPNVAFSIAEPGPVNFAENPVCHTGQDFLSILGQGVMRELPLEERHHAVEMIMRRYAHDNEKTWEFPQAMLAAMGIYEMEVVTISAKRRFTPR